MDVRSVLLLRVSSPVDKEVDHPQFFDPPYPLKHLQAALTQYPDLVVHFLDCWIHPRTVSQLQQHAAHLQPSMIVVSASSFDVGVANEFVYALKQQARPPLVVGIGQGYYLNRDVGNNAVDAYDAILLGEAEQEFFGLFDSIRTDGPSGGTWREYYRACYREGKRFLVEDPDSLPFPSYTAQELKSYRSIYPVQLSKRVVWGFLIATRGCPHGCMFCSEVMRVSIGKRIRTRSATNVADEMAHLARQGVNICSFQDDSFSTNRRFVEALCRELIARNSQMPWMARVRVDEVDYDLLTLMKKAGCIMLGIGVESGSQRIVENMRKQSHPKPWPGLCRRVFAWTRSLGIGSNAYYVIGNPTETREEIEQTIKLALELGSDSIQVHFYTPYPGSAAWEKYRDQFSTVDPTKMFHYSAPMLPLAAVSNDELIGLRSRFYRRYLFRPGFAVQHLWRHAGFYWHNLDILWTLLGIRRVL
jgi:anaerobic magnesium-protoporphyrin IX monomethyl ester cyclase